MEKFNNNYIAFFILILYGILNFLNFTDAFVCVSENHIGLNFFGIDRCCIENEEHFSNHNVAEYSASMHKHCNDKHLSVNMQELFSNTYSDLVYVLQNEMKEIVDIICNQYSLLYYLKTITQQRAPNSIHLLSVLNKIKLTI